MTGQNINVFYMVPGALKAKGFEKRVLDYIVKRLSYHLPQNEFSYCEVVDENDYQDRRLKVPKEVNVLLTLGNPILDIALLKDMVEAAFTKRRRIVSQGAVPGTAPCFVEVCDNKGVNAQPYICYSDLQCKYNTQLNIFRFKRLRLFQKFDDEIKDFYKMGLEDLLEFNSSKKGVEFILSYTSSKPMEFHKGCPLCESKDHHELHSEMSHPVTGFLTRQSAYYHLCRDCGLVFLNPYLPDDELWRYYDEYAYESGLEIDETIKTYDNLTPDNTSALYNYESVLPCLKKMSQRSSLLDLGGGTGQFGVFVRQNFPSFQIEVCDYRVNEKIVKALKKRDVSSRQINFLNEPLGTEEYDVITNWEVLEHLPLGKLKDYLTKVAQALKKGGMFIISTPDYDDPYCQILDFWAAYPGEHLSVLSRRVLEPLFEEVGLKVVEEFHESVTLKTSGKWFQYASLTSANETAKSMAFVIDQFLKNDEARVENRRLMQKANQGSEIILCAVRQ